MTTKTTEVPGVGTLAGTALVLTQGCTRACGHLLHEGDDGDDDARRLRRRVADDAAQRIGRPVEVYASAPRNRGWIVSVHYPRVRSA